LTRTWNEKVSSGKVFLIFDGVGVTEVSVTATPETAMRPN